MALLNSNSQDLFEQFTSLLNARYRDPAIVILDPLVGLIVKHGRWKYVAKSMTEGFAVAMAWSKRSRPAKEPYPKTSLLHACCDFLSSVNQIKEHGATKSEIAAASRFIGNAI